MRNLIIAAILLSGSAIADDLTIPNTFTAGTPARAADVNGNFTAVEASVDDNAADIAVNTTAIETNATDVAANTLAIGSNTAGVTANATAIGNNTTEIDANRAAIQDNTDAIASIASIAGAFVKANGQIVGLFLQSQSGGPPLEQTWVWVLSDSGYMFAVAPYPTAPTPTRTGAAGEIYQERVVFDGPNCTGQAYVETSVASRQTQFHSGYVFTSEDLNDPSPVYYSPVGSPVLTNVPQQSTRSETGCISAVGTIISAVAILPNDPTITGVPSQRNLDAPITLGR